MSYGIRICKGDWIWCDGDCANCRNFHSTVVYDTKTDSGIIGPISHTAKVEVAGDGMTHWYECGACHGAVDNGDAYCKHCGSRLERE